MDDGLRNLIAKAEQGDVEAMVMVGDCYHRGFHAEKDEVKALFYYKMAADRGHPGGAFMTALSYMLGTGVKKDVETAVQYMQDAASKGWVNAQYMLGSMYETGTAGFLFKDKKAAKYYEMAARQGHAEAQLKLGYMNIQKKGAQFSLENSLFWFVCAYLHGNDAQEESRQAMDRLNYLLRAGLPGGRDRIDKIIQNVKTNYPQYMRNPN